MKEYKVGNIDKAIIRNCVYKMLGGSAQTGGNSAIKNVFLNKLYEDGIDYEAIKGSTYEITSLDGKSKYLIVISCYSEKRKQKSSYTVGKEIADRIKEERGVDSWYAVFVTVSEDRTISGVTRVCKDKDLVLSKNVRSSGRGVYYACSKAWVDEDMNCLEFDEWYKNLK